MTNVPALTTDWIPARELEAGDTVLSTGTPHGLLLEHESATDVRFTVVGHDGLTSNALRDTLKTHRPTTIGHTMSDFIPPYAIERNPYCPDCGGDEYHADYCPQN